MGLPGRRRRPCAGRSDDPGNLHRGRSRRCGALRTRAGALPAHPRRLVARGEEPLRPELEGALLGRVQGGSPLRVPGPPRAARGPAGRAAGGIRRRPDGRGARAGRGGLENGNRRRQGARRRLGPRRPRGFRGGRALRGKTGNRPRDVPSAPHGLLHGETPAAHRAALRRRRSPDAELRFSESGDGPGSRSGAGARLHISLGPDEARIIGRAELARFLFGAPDSNPPAFEGAASVIERLQPAFPLPTPWYGLNFV